MVGDPDVADVNPLTDHALSILGKKIGTTRVTVYGQDKKLVGIFDIEVSYDVSRLAAEIAHFTGGGIKVSSIDGRIMLSGTSPDAVTLDKAVTIAKQFAPDIINTVQVTQPQQVMLEVRFIEASRQAGRELGVQWNVFGNRFLANVGNQVPASQLPITAANGSFQQPALSGAGIGGANIAPAAATMSPIVAAGVLSGASPFGFLIGRLVGGQFPIDVELNALEQKGLVRSLAQPNLTALSGDTASFLAGGEYPIPVPGSLGQTAIEYKKYGVGLAFTPTVLTRRPDQSRDQAEREPARSGPRRVHHRRRLGAGADRPRGLDHGGIARRPELHARRPAAEHQPDQPGSAALARRRSGARRAVPQRRLPEERDRSGHRGDAAHRASVGAGRSASTRRSTARCPATTSTFS